MPPNVVSPTKEKLLCHLLNGEVRPIPYSLRNRKTAKTLDGPDIEPPFCVLAGWKRLDTDCGPHRYRLRLETTTGHLDGMLNTDLNYIIDRNIIRKGCTMDCSESYVLRFKRGVVVYVTNIKIVGESVHSNMLDANIAKEQPEND